LPSDEERPGQPSVYGCPECGGVLWELHDGEMMRFRCRVGHSYTAEGLLAVQSDVLDTALWSAYRALEENASLARRLAKRAKENQGSQILIKRFEQRAEDAQEQAELIKKLLQSGELAEPVEKADVTE